MQLLPLHGVQRSPTFAQFIFYTALWVSLTSIHDCLHTLGFVFVKFREKMDTVYSLVLQIVCNGTEKGSVCTNPVVSQGPSVCGGLSVAGEMLYS